jgi:hypothetical protein
MAALTPPRCDFGWKAPDFSLLGTDNRHYKRDELCGDNGLLVMFICNHCPFVQAIISRLVKNCQQIQDRAENNNSIVIFSLIL